MKMKKIKILNKKTSLIVLSVFLFASLVFALTFIDKLQSDFDLGIYNQTEYNSSVGSGAVQLNLSFNNGTYTSQIFSTGSNVSLNNLSWEYQRIQCPEGMAYINKLNGYCIDKYEASMPSANSTDMGNATDVANRNAPGAMQAISQAGVVPWVRISQVNARIACLNAGKHLCTDEEWLAAANLNGSYFNLPTTLSASSGYYCVVDSNTYCLDHSYESGEACNTGTYSGGASNCYSLEGVYDMTGNVWEWTNETIGYTKPCNTGSSGWCYWNGTGFQTGTDANTAVYGNDGVYFTANTTTNKAVRRGGSWFSGAGAGPFGAYLYTGPTDTYFNVGFRCCSS